MNSNKQFVRRFFSMVDSQSVLKAGMKNGANMVIAVVLAMMVGCGGGGSSSTSSDNNLPSPVAGGIEDGELVPGQTGKPPITNEQQALLPKINVGSSQYADPNVLVTLSATVEAAAGAQIAQTLWTQISGPTVRIPNPSALTNLVLIPDVVIATPVEFRFTAVDDQGRVNSTTLLVLVKPVPGFMRVIGGVFSETDLKAAFSVRLYEPSDTAITVAYRTSGGTATAGEDYVPVSGELVFEPGVTQLNVSVDLLDDEIAESDEVFNLVASTTIGEEIFASSGVAIIRDGVEPTQTQTIQFSEAGPITVYEGDTYSNPLDPEVVPAGSGEVIYSSSNSSVASVDSGGVVTAFSPGTAQITALKVADDIYLSAEASYDLQVLSRGAAPSVLILYSGGEGQLTADTNTVISIQNDETLDLTCDVQDPEDGQIPDPDTGLPADAITWTSSLDGVLATGPVLDISTLTQGQHNIVCQAVDSDGNVAGTSIGVLVGNIAPTAFASATSSLCPEPTLDPGNCYSPERTNDSDISTVSGGFTSWRPLSGTDQSVSLSWSGNATFTRIDVYSTEGAPIRDYDLEYFDGEGWVTIESVDGNTDVVRVHSFAQITTSQIRVVVRAGPDGLPTSGRVNEIVVWGQVSFFS